MGIFPWMCTYSVNRVIAMFEGDWNFEDGLKMKGNSTSKHDPVPAV